jgi:hypothetical protein
MNMKAILIFASAAIIACAALGVEGAPANATKTCRGFTGARWKDVYNNTGTKYYAMVRGVTCAFVKPWVARLSRGRPGGSAPIKGGPAGFTCYTQGVYSPTFEFVCSKGMKQSFYVGPDTSHR